MFVILKSVETFPINEAGPRWKAYWDNLHAEWFKLEVLQDYLGVDDSPSLRAWLAGNRQLSISLLGQGAQGIWARQCREKSDAGVLMRRVRVIETPLTPYTAWELEFYRHLNLPNGELVYMINRTEVADLTLPTGDLMMFDNERLVVCAYDDNGGMTHQTFYDQRDNLAPFLELKDKLLAIARPLEF